MVDLMKSCKSILYTLEKKSESLLLLLLSPQSLPSVHLRSFISFTHTPPHRADFLCISPSQMFRSFHSMSPLLPINSFPGCENVVFFEAVCLSCGREKSGKAIEVEKSSIQGSTYLYLSSDVSILHKCT